MNHFRQIKRFSYLTGVLGGLAAPLAAEAEILIGLAAPLTGDLAWHGELAEQALALAAEELNEADGLLGEPVAVLKVDDFCDPDQAVAAARKLVEAGVAAVIGHPCSGAALAASAIYHKAGILFISPAASNPKLTEEGFDNVFRVVGRDDRQSALAAEYLATLKPGTKIAIVHDGQAFGRGLAEQMRQRLAARGIEIAMYQQIVPERADYLDVVERMRAERIEVVYFGGYAAEAGLIVRHAHDLGHDIQLVSGDNLNTQYLWQVAGEAAEGTLFTTFPDARELPAAARFVRTFRARYQEPESIAVYTYAAAEVWQQAVALAGSPRVDAVAEALRRHTFETVLGAIGFDTKGDVTGYDTYAWYVWRNGDYVPLERAGMKE